jgi:hypothetical protein
MKERRKGRVGGGACGGGGRDMDAMPRRMKRSCDGTRWETLRKCAGTGTGTGMHADQME